LIGLNVVYVGGWLEMWIVGGKRFRADQGNLVNLFEAYLQSLGTKAKFT
jgi:hypothetical protein